jgi:hypothetical protein
MEDTEDKKKCTFSNDEYEQIANARDFFYNTLKMYKLYVDNESLYSDVYCCCDRCYTILPKWNPKNKFYKNEHGIVFCHDCYDEGLNNEEKLKFSLLEFEKRENGLYA